MSGSSPRTLADQLRGWSPERLAGLLRARPDLASPAPRDSAQLAARAVVRTSVLRALEDLDRFHLAVLEVLAQAPTAPEHVAELVHADPVAIGPAIRLLLDRALAWGPEERPRATGMVSELLALPPGPDLAKVPALLDELPPQARAMLDHLDATDADGTSQHANRPITREAARTPVEHLLARRLLVPRDDTHVAVPWTVRLTLRGGRSTHERVDVPPELAASERDQGLLDRTAAGAAFELVRRTELLLDHWGTQPPAALRAGGLGVREVKAAAGFLQVETDVLVLVVETAAAAGLLAVGMTDDLDSAWLPTEAFDAWQVRPAADRWLVLARAWLASPRVLPVAGGPADARTGKPANALAPGLEQPWVPGQRRAVLGELATLAPRQHLAVGTGVSSLVERLRWRHPRRPEGHLRQVDPVLQQAALLGITALDGLSGFGRELLDGSDQTAATLASLLPQPVDHLLLQADLTAIAPGPLTQELGRDVALLAEVESRGGATVYRFSAPSVRRAFDAGWSAGEVHEFLAKVSSTPVPQALTYLVDDVARRFGTVRAGQAESFLRSDDETALAELVHSPQAANLRLRRIAPTVVVSDVPLQTLLPRLRELGVAPVVEAPDGTVRVARPDIFRARTPKARVDGYDSGRGRARTEAHVSAVVTAIRSGDRTAAHRPRRGPANTPADVVTLLRQAIEDRSGVLIGYLDNHGSATERRVRPQRVEGGRLTAYDERSDDVRDFAIHRITTAALLGS